MSQDSWNVQVLTCVQEVWEGKRQPRSSCLRQVEVGLHEDSVPPNALPNTADWTLTAKPLPCPPEGELRNPVTCSTIRNNAHLFKIVTPINVDVFEKYLVSHPNREFVNSVVIGLWEGFWPFANTNINGHPVEQVQTEVDKECFSLAFGPDLLPGMYSMPIHAVPKPSSDTFRLEVISSFPLDNILHLGYHLINHQSHFPLQQQMLWKSDVSEVYRLMPMHPHWQLKQVNTLHGHRHVDCCNTFGGSASGGIWISFMVLVIWIVREIERLHDVVGGYVDDVFGLEKEGNYEWYNPYSQHMPATQARLLQLWDALGICHKQKKQIWGLSLPIIGLDINTVSMTISLADNKKAMLIEELRVWSSPAHTPGNTGSFNIRRWQQLSGWINWALNTYLLLCPGLNNVYPKMHGYSSPFTQVYVNNAVRSDLSWIAGHLKQLSSVQMLDSIAWSPADADIVVFCDACLEGMGFWFPDFDVGYYTPTPTDSPSGIIFYFEALCDLICSSENSSKKVLVYTDNQNTVDIFSSLCFDRLLSRNHNFQVVHVADAISHEWIGDVIDCHPNFRLHFFRPPHVPCYTELQKQLPANPSVPCGPKKSYK
ncbi:DNA/RNA polymerase [Coprinopsis sp. MPI-PUGE-AT-0042]|nr:DNA/RNA polymerase [Coprinopsis sp. MPI-PUGE-AT-0042]